MKLHATLLLAVAMQLAIGVAGCRRSSDASDDANPAAAEVDPASATDVGPTVATDPLPAPPEPKEEVPGPAPSDHHVWIEGYWWFDHPKHAYEWTPGFWQDRLVVANAAPPAILYENPYRAPGEGYSYIPGYWMWRGSEYVWFHGYWGPHHDGWAYVHPYWEARGGHWGCAGWGWERYHAGWNTDHVGWEFHAGVWERPVEFQARVAVARGHAADFRVTPGTWHGQIRGRAGGDVHAGGNVYPGDTVHASGHVAVKEGEEHPAGHEDRGVRPVHTGHPSERPAPEGHAPEAHAAAAPGKPHYDTHPAEGHHAVERKP